MDLYLARYLNASYIIEGDTAVIIILCEFDPVKCIFHEHVRGQSDDQDIRIRNKYVGKLTSQWSADNHIRNCEVPIDNSCPEILKNTRRLLHSPGPASREYVLFSFLNWLSKPQEKQKIDRSR